MQPWDPGRVQVTNSSGIHGDIMAQYVLCAMLMVNQHTRVYVRQQSAKIWRKHLSRSIEGQTLAVVGFGHVGAAIGALARANGMRVLGVRSSPQPSPAADEVVGLDRLHDVLGECEHVAITLPLTEATRGLIGRRELAALRPEAHFINVSRGGIVDEDALHEALTSGAIACATLDVFASEPLPLDSPFWSLDNVVLTPHSSSDIEGWQQRVIDLFSDNLRRWLDGRPLRNVVDPARGY
jgi:phosphoglycerate dehydrogenase-like enzyme